MAKVLQAAFQAAFSIRDESLGLRCFHTGGHIGISRARIAARSHTRIDRLNFRPAYQLANSPVNCKRSQNPGKRVLALSD